MRILGKEKDVYGLLMIMIFLLGFLDHSTTISHQIEAQKITIRTLSSNSGSTTLNNNQNEILDTITLESDTLKSNESRIRLQTQSENITWDSFVNFSRYVGGNDLDYGQDVVVDTQRNIFMTGETKSLDFPIINAYQSSSNGNEEIFLSKFSSNGTLKWSTYLGGSGNEIGIAIALDNQSNVVITGYTRSSDFPTLSAYDSSFNGVYDIFLSKFSSDGMLLWSTFFGGSDLDYSYDIYTDKQNNIILTGYTDSLDFPTLNAYNSTNSGEEDVFLSKFSHNGTLLWSTYHGGSDYDLGKGVVVDYQGDILTTGYTASSNFPTLNAYNSSHNGGPFDIFISKFSSEGILKWSTYLGGNDSDYGKAVCFDFLNNVYITGDTNSADYPTINAYDSTYNGQGDTFLTKFSSSGALVWSTYIGGSALDWGYSMDINMLGNVVLTGTTSSTNFPVLNPLFETKKGSSEAYITSFSSNGSLLFSSFFGGSSFDQGWGVDVDNLNNVVISGYTGSANFPIVNSNDTLLGTTDAILFSFNLTMVTEKTTELLFSMVLDSSAYSDARSVVFDHLGNVILAGSTYSNDFPTKNAWDSTHNGANDGFIAKFNSTGSLLWSTYLGASEMDYCYGIAVDSQNNIVVSGYTWYWGGQVTSFPASNQVHNGLDDIFVTKFDENGSLIWSELFGGDSSDRGYDVEVDENDSIYITGTTQSTNFPILNAYDSTHNGFGDVVLMKLHSNGTLNWSTFMGGSTTDRAFCLDVKNDSIAISGDTSSDNFPTKNAYISSRVGSQDSFVAKFLLNGSLVWSTFLGGTHNDFSYGISIDSTGRIVTVGSTYSTNFPTLNAYDSSDHGGWDVFVSQFSTEGSLTWSTYLGGGSDDYANDVDLLSEDNILLTGKTGSNDYPILNALNPTRNGSTDVFFSLLDPNGVYLYGSYFGGNGSDTAESIDVNQKDDFAFVGSTKSLNFPITDTNDSRVGTGQDGFVSSSSRIIFEKDSDQDGMPDWWEEVMGFNSTDPIDADLDEDSDGIPNLWEYQMNLIPVDDTDASLDYDNDGLSNLQEYGEGTNANSADTDSDLMPDGWEVNMGLNATLDDADLDKDNDALTNLKEYYHGLNATNPDTDSDNLTDGWEVSFGMNASKTHVPHTPMVLNGNSDFIIRATNEGWPGDGNKSTPYIIDGFIFNNTAIAIEIRNTDLYFKISDCLFMNGGSGAIYFYNVLNSNITSNFLINNIGSGTGGINLESCINNTIHNNLCYNSSQIGIHLDSSSYNNRIANNTVNLSEVGIYIASYSEDNHIYQNRAFENMYGIRISLSDLNSVYNNTCFNSSLYGISIQQGDKNSVFNNSIFSSTDFGLYIGTGNGNTLENNSIHTSGDRGLYIYNSQHNLISHNIISDGLRGIYLSGVLTTNNTIWHNTIFNNSEYGFVATSQVTSPNLFYLNNVLSNTGQTIDYTGAIKYYVNGFGNYWGDAYSGDDLDADGIGDTAYNFYDNSDPYPLVSFITPSTHLLSKPQLINPTNPDFISGNLAIDWMNSSDTLDHNINYSVYYSPDDGFSWIILGSGLESSQFDWDTTTVDDGSNYRIMVIVNCSEDLSHNVTTNTFTIDNHHPSVTLQNVLNDTSIMIGLVELNITDITLDDVWYNWDGTVNQSLSFPWQVSTPAEENYHWLTIYANDTLGRLTVSKFRWWINKNPEITLLSPINNSVQPYGSILSFNISDNNIDETWFNWDDGINQSLSVDWNITLGISDGWHKLTVYANDTAGWLSYRSYYFYCEANYPIIIVQNVANDTTVPSDMVIQLNITDFSLNQTWYNWDGGANQTFSSPWDVTVPITEGYHILGVYANDSVGHETKERFRWWINYIPNITLLIPTNNSIQNFGSILSFNITDNNLDTAWYNWDDGINQSLGIDWNITLDILDGWHSLTVFANDSNGWISSKSYYFYCEADFPIIIVQNVANDTAVPSDMVIQLNITDFSLNQTWYNWNNGVNQTFSSPWELGVPATEGFHILRVYANDSAGHTTKEIFQWWINYIPDIALISPTNNSIQAFGNILSFNITDNNLAQTWYNWDNGVNQSFGVDWNITLDVSDGWHSLAIFANDSNGWLSINSYYFYCEADSPIISVQNVANDTTVPSDMVVQLNITDFTLNQTWYNWDNGPNQTLSSPWEIHVPSLEGYYTLFVYANDSVGHTTVKRFYWWINHVPSVTLILPINNSIQPFGSILHFNFSDNNLAQTWFMWDEGLNQSFVTGWDIPLDISDGWHVLTVYANDTDGWISHKVYYFYCEADSPIIMIQNGVNDTVVPQDMIIQFNITDFSLNRSYYAWDDGTDQSFNYPWNINLPSGEGYHYLTITAFDSYGHWITKVFRFYVNYSPRISLESPTNNSILLPAGVITFAINDLNLTSVQYHWDTQDNITLQEPFVIDAPTTPGYHSIVLIAVDMWGETASLMLRFYILDTDAFSSFVEVTSQPPSTAYEGESFVYSFTIYNPELVSLNLTLFAFGIDDEIVSGNGTNILVAPGESVSFELVIKPKHASLHQLAINLYQGSLLYYQEVLEFNVDIQLMSPTFWQPIVNIFLIIVGIMVLLGFGWVSKNALKYPWEKYRTQRRFKQEGVIELSKLESDMKSKDYLKLKSAIQPLGVVIDDKLISSDQISSKIKKQLVSEGLISISDLSLTVNLSESELIGIIREIPDLRLSAGNCVYSKSSLTKVCQETISGSQTSKDLLIANFRESFSEIEKMFETEFIKGLLAQKITKGLEGILTSFKAQFKVSDVIREKLDLWIDVIQTIDDYSQVEVQKYPVQLLTLIEETNGKFYPKVIAWNVLKLIKEDTSKFTDEQSLSFKEWMLNIKEGYFKLIMLSKNLSISLESTLREEIPQIAEELLLIPMNVIRRNFWRQIDNFPKSKTKIPSTYGIQGIQAARLGEIMSNFISILFPPAYSEFPIPYLHIFNEIIKAPQKISKAIFDTTGVNLHHHTYQFIIVQSLAQPKFKRDQFFEHNMKEYIKTYALIIRESAAVIANNSKGKVTAKVLLVNRVNSLMKQHNFQLPPEEINEALEKSGWNPAIRQLLIEKKNYCLQCTEILAEETTRCPNCEKMVTEIPDAISIDQIRMN